jgi:hypothetical protein
MHISVHKSADGIFNPANWLKAVIRRNKDIAKNEKFWPLARQK